MGAQKTIPGIRPSWREAVRALGRKEAQLMLSGAHRLAWLREMGYSVVDGDGVAKASHAAVRARLSDFFPTPPDVLDALLDSRFPPPPGPVLDPCAGDGAILRRLRERGWALHDLFACEVRGEEAPGLRALAEFVAVGDWHEALKAWPFPVPLPCPECSDSGTDPCGCCGRMVQFEGRPMHSWWRGWPASTVITNVPYGDCPAFPLACLSPDLPGALRYLALLMPIEELAGVRRIADFLQQHPPTALVPLMWRPFTNVRGVAWYIWERDSAPLNIDWR